MTNRSAKFGLVTGASRGIGRAVALSLARQGFQLELWARTAADLASSCQACRVAGAEVGSSLVDVSDAVSVQRAASELERRGDGLDVLVVNAGIGLWAPFSEVSLENWRTTLATNLDGAFYTLQSALPLLLKREGATVLVIGSDSAEYGFENRAPYCASKWGLRGLVESFRKEYRRRGLMVTMISVSRVKTHFGGKAPEQRATALDAEELGELTAWLVNRPPGVEYREVKVSALAAAYGE